MKKLLLLPTLLLALNLGAATTEQNTESQNDASTAEQTKITETTIDKKTPSFLIRHADKLKKVSYVGDGVFYAGIVGMIAATIVEKIGNNDLPSLIGKSSFWPFLIGAIAKLILDTPTKYAINKKHTFELEALQAKLDAAQEEKVATEQK